ncbi:MAG: LysR family transcriptional regulator [Tepidiformaceae bacterium]
MRIEAIDSFAQVVRAGSYAAASELMFLSPTTIHGHIKSLEIELQSTLLHFHGRKLELTQAGSRFFVFAEKLLEEHAKLERDILGLARSDGPRLRIASLHGPSVHLLPPVITAFRKLNPEVLVTVHANGVGECAARLLAGEVDIAILNDAHREEFSHPYQMTPLYEDTVDMVVRADSYRPPDLTLLAELPLALQPKSSVYRQQLERWARSEGIALTTTFEHGSFDGLLSFALRGGCVAMVGGYVSRLSPSAPLLRVLQLPNFVLRRQVVAFHLAGRDSLSTRFLESFHAYFAVLRSAGPFEKLVDSGRESLLSPPRPDV